MPPLQNQINQVSPMPSLGPSGGSPNMFQQSNAQQQPPPDFFHPSVVAPIAKQQGGQQAVLANIRNMFTHQMPPKPKLPISGGQKTATTASSVDKIVSRKPGKPAPRGNKETISIMPLEKLDNLTPATLAWLKQERASGRQPSNKEINDFNHSPAGQLPAMPVTTPQVSFNREMTKLLSKSAHWLCSVKETWRI